jgi:alpha-L-fucosidase 2
MHRFAPPSGIVDTLGHNPEKTMMMTLCLLVAITASAAGQDVQPTAAQGLHYDKPAMVWDEAMPLGNGLMGGLVWGDGKPIKISLDRTDLWDLRPVPEFHEKDYNYKTMREWEKSGRIEDLLAMYDNPYNRPAPTKIPAGRIELTFHDGWSAVPASLDLAKAEAKCGDPVGNESVSVWIHATEPVGFIELSGVLPAIKLAAPAFAGEEPGDGKPAISAGNLKQLGYPAAKTAEGDDFQSYEQEGWGGFRWAVFLVWKKLDSSDPAQAGGAKDGAGETPAVRSDPAQAGGAKDGAGETPAVRSDPAQAGGAPAVRGGRWQAAWSIATSNEDANPLALAEKRARAGLQDIEALRSSHQAWWRKWWDDTWLEVPNAAVERQWYLDTYKFGAAARRDTPPITLQGPWTADDGKLPPWKGDYHHDLNTELSYWPCYSGNRLEQGLGYLNWLWDTRENARDWTKRFFEMPGINVPMTADLRQNQIGGWRQYTHSSTTGAWLAHHFYMHWKYSQDRNFLEQRAFPWLRDCAIFAESVTSERDANGKRTLPLSSSPEINDNKPDAWFPAITNYDLALFRWLFGATAELADELKFPDQAAHWRAVLDELPGFALGDEGQLLVAPGCPLKDSHRHFSHLMAIHPLGLIDVSQGENCAITINAAMSELERLGSGQWCGYSFAWLASLAARSHDGVKAEKALDTFANAFVLRNGFHCNGDQSGKDFSKFTYRPFTLEGNFAAAAGLQEMLIQSHAGAIEVFPAVPDTWRKARFHRLRAMGAFVVSSEMQDGAVRYIEIVSETGAAPVVRSPWSGGIFALEKGVTPSGMRVENKGDHWLLEPAL